MPPDACVESLLLFCRLPRAQHRNVVSTYHYDIKPVRAVMDDGADDGLKLHVADESVPLGTTDWKL